MDKEVSKILDYLLKRNKRNALNSTSRGIVSLINDGNELVTIDTRKKSACFHGDFPRLAPKIEQLIPLIDYL